MKTRWFTNAAIVAVALCSASGLLYAQDNGDAPVPVTRNVWTGVYSIAQARRGQDTYYQVCAQCHGRELEGDDSEGVTPLAGPHFMTNWDTHTAADLVKRIHAQPNDEPGDIDLPTQTDLFASSWRAIKSRPARKICRLTGTPPPQSASRRSRPPASRPTPRPDRI